MVRRGLLIALAAVLVAGIGWKFFSTWADIVTVGQGVLNALWTLPLLIGVHLIQLFLSGAAWWSLFAAPAPRIVTCFYLRLIREGIDSLFPVAQIGGEVIGARMLAKAGIEAARAAASVIVDVSMEVLAQAVFLLAGVGTLAVLAGGEQWIEWSGSLALAAIGAGGFLLAQRFGLPWLLEMLTDRIGGRFADLAILSLTGLHTAASAFYSRTCALLRAGLFHLVSWSLGTIESWIVLYALGVPASLPQALVVESLGLAARTAGFAIPGALAVQEGGFALAALSVGLPESAGLSLSLVKRAREVLVGAAGVTMAWWKRGFR
ncbi:MAG TPA: lysylphosphatidylglycerol synthase domain-containing protein [Rhodopila sp.]|jgi:putative membrane protein